MCSGRGSGWGACFGASAAAVASLTAPRGRGYAPLPRTPTRGKLSLQAFFCALRARVRFAQFFCAGACSHPPVCALVARSRRGRSLRSRPPREWLRAPSSDSHPRQAELAGCLLRAARTCALRAVFLLAHAAARPCAFCSCSVFVFFASMLGYECCSLFPPLCFVVVCGCVGCCSDACLR